MTPIEADAFINEELEIRKQLVEDVKFRELCVKVCKELGITAAEWNANRADICLYIANQFIGLDNKGDGKLREYLTK
jgi:hypothetical protein